MSTIEVWKSQLVCQTVSIISTALSKMVVEEYQRRLACSVIESPIEAAFWAWWRAAQLADQALGRPALADIRPQYEVMCGDQLYRLDFAVPEVCLAIELDGHEFHERSIDQVVVRDRRDRDLQRAGWCVFHFSGSEFVGDPYTVVNEVVAFIHECHGETNSTNG